VKVCRIVVKGAYGWQESSGKYLTRLLWIKRRRIWSNVILIRSRLSLNEGIFRVASYTASDEHIDLIVLTGWGEDPIEREEARVLS